MSSTNVENFLQLFYLLVKRSFGHLHWISDRVTNYPHDVPQTWPTTPLAFLACECSNLIDPQVIPAEKCYRMQPARAYKLRDPTPMKPHHDRRLRVIKQPAALRTDLGELIELSHEATRPLNLHRPIEHQLPRFHSANV